MISSAHDVVIEVPLSVFVNGRHALTAMISPVMLEEFVTGFLYTERIIREPEEIESLSIEAESTGTPSASVLTKNPYSIMLSSKTVLSGCGGDTSYLDPDRLPKVKSDMTIELSTIKENNERNAGFGPSYPNRWHSYCGAIWPG